MDTVGRKVRMLRALKGWSQTKLAREIGVGQDTISAIERGEHEPRASTLRKLASGLDVEIAELFEEPTTRPLPANEEAGEERHLRAHRYLIKEATRRWELKVWPETPDAQGIETEVLDVDFGFDEVEELSEVENVLWQEFAPELRRNRRLAEELRIVDEEERIAEGELSEAFWLYQALVDFGAVVDECWTVAVRKFVSERLESAPALDHEPTKIARIEGQREESKRTREELVRDLRELAA